MLDELELLMLELLDEPLLLDELPDDEDEDDDEGDDEELLEEESLLELLLEPGGVPITYPYKNEPDRIAYYRHRACRLEPLRIEGQWYLEITPTYHFTFDGRKLSFYYEDALSQIKMLERQNKTHLRQVKLWEEVLTERHIRTTPKAVQRGLFSNDDAAKRPKIECLTERNGVVQFGPLLQFEADWTVPEKFWLAMGRGDDSFFDPQLELF